MGAVDKIKIHALRMSLKKEALSLGKNKLLLLKDNDKSNVDSLLFNRNKDGSKSFIFDYSILSKINFENVSFKDFKAKDFDFSKLHNVHINPQEIYNKDLSYSILSGVEFDIEYGDDFIDIFDDVYVVGTNFNRSSNGIIDPQTIRNKDLSNAYVSSVAIIDDFKGVKEKETRYGELTLVEREELSILLSSYKIACSSEDMRKIINEDKEEIDKNKER